jgi:glycosyltransferase involved in cell wall biosynthesis
LTAIRIDGGTFVVVSSGEAEGPSQPLVRFLADRGAARVTFIAHPLLAEDAGGHRRIDLVDGVLRRHRPLRLPNRPPLTYAFDPFAPPVVARCDAWIGFNCLATAQGLVGRALGRTRRVIHWNVDFVPTRFGASVLTRVYDRLDAWCCRRADGRVELSAAARDGRIERYGLSDLDRVEIIPMGAWTDDAPIADQGRLDERRVVFVGHLVERMGVDIVLDAVEALQAAGRPIRADIVGGGPLFAPIRAAVRARRLSHLIEVHGFVEDFGTVRRIVASASIGVAPYEDNSDSFSRFADPGKLKVYLGAGLPILLTAVPPNAGELAKHGGAEIVDANGPAFAARIDALLGDPVRWAARHADSLRYRQRFDWRHLFEQSLPRLGLSVGDGHGGRTNPSQNGSPK